MAARPSPGHHRGVPEPQPLPLTTKKRKSWRIDPDAPLRWGCSLKGWNCCIDAGIAVRPYDMLRLRHAAGRPAHELVNDATVTFEWEPGSGILLGRLAHRPYEGGRVACVFLEELTNLDLRRIRDEEPDRFAGFPEHVQRAADSGASGEWKVAGLCGVHTGRPEVCRGFPFQRLPAPDGAAAGSEVHQLFRCGSCALATETTARAVLDDESLEEHWRAADAFRQLCRYLFTVGAANSPDPAYRHLLPDQQQRLQLWAALYLPDTHPALAGDAEQWRAPLDHEGDRALYRALLDDLLARVDALVARGGGDEAAFGMPGDSHPRPDLDTLLDPARLLLPPRAAA